MKKSTNMSCHVMMLLLTNCLLPAAVQRVYSIHLCFFTFMCSVSWAIPWWKHFKTATVNEQLFFESLSSIIIIKACTFPFIHPRMIFPLLFSLKDKFPENLYAIHQPLHNSHLCSSSCTSWGSLNAHFLGWPRWSTRSRNDRFLWPEATDTVTSTVHS